MCVSDLCWLSFPLWLLAAHLPFSHHKLTPVMLRERASSMPFTQLEVPAGSNSEEAEARPSFSFAHKAPLAAFSFPSGVRLSRPWLYNPSHFASAQLCGRSAGSQARTLMQPVRSRHLQR